MRGRPVVVFDWIGQSKTSRALDRIYHRHIRQAADAVTNCSGIAAAASRGWPVGQHNIYFTDYDRKGKDVCLGGCSREVHTADGVHTECHTHA